jgi:hypothetical protein
MDDGRGRMTRAALAVTLALLSAPSVSLAGPVETAETFVRAVQRADFEGAKRLLEDPKYRGQPRGGDDAYFVYESGYEPNLAVLVGRPYGVTATLRDSARSDWHILDGTTHATVSARIGFAPEHARPWILPPAMAFGRRMPLDAFLSFVAAPEREWQYLTLRLRAGLDAVGTRPPPVSSIPPPPAPHGARTLAAAPERGGVGLFGPRSFDAGPVMLPSGQSLPREEVERRLPRLTAMTLDVTLVQRGRFASWKVSCWLFDDILAMTERGPVVINVGPNGRDHGQK